jgi:hypothetical protein
MSNQVDEPKFHISKDWRKLTPEETKVLDELKVMEQDFLTYLKGIWHSTIQADKRWLSIARTHIEEASMAARKAVSRPNTVDF